MKFKKSSEFKMSLLFSRMVSVVASILFAGLDVSVVFCVGRTDTMCENNDHLFGRGLVGQL